jgi:esterase FrsA
MMTSHLTRLLEKALPLSNRLINTLIVCLVLLPVEPPNAADNELVEERRLRLWSAQTGNQDLVYSTVLRIDNKEGTDPGSWVYEWSSIGDYFADQGEQSARADDKAAARNAYLTAAKFYGIARFPAKVQPGQTGAYQKHLENYKLAGQFFDPALIVIDIPFDGASIQGYLHMPTDAEKPPLILWNGGIDTWKGDVYNNIQPYIEQGFAVLTFDVLGTGENSGWQAEKDSNKLHSAVIDFMQTHPLIDGKKIAHVGFSFSGYYAARNALTEPRLFAVISACGPIHDGWQAFRNTSAEIKEALSAAIHIPAADVDESMDYIAGFSLVEQGLLNGPDSLKVPTLIVNGDLDDLAPVSDLRLLADSGHDTTLWIMGGDQHCFGQYRSIVMPKMAAWLESKLTGEQNVSN